MIPFDRGRGLAARVALAGMAGLSMAGSASALPASNIPMQVPGISSVVDVAAGYGHSLALRSDGTVWAWGSNARGELGDGTTASRHTPAPVVGLTGFMYWVAGAGSFSMSLGSDGQVWTWGDNFAGELGTGETCQDYDSCYRATPLPIPGLSNVRRIAANGAQAAALKWDGTVWTWGYTYGGRASRVPVQVPGLSDVTFIATGANHVLAARSDGTVWAWGHNSGGCLGDGTLTTPHPTPIQVLGLADVVSVSAGDSVSLARKTDGTVWAWGSNFHDSLGLGTGQGNSATPVQVGVSAAQALRSGSHFSLCLKTNGTLRSWGDNTFGQLGDGTNQSWSSGPVRVTNMNDVFALSATYLHALVRRGNGTVWAWGNNSWGQLGFPP